MKQLFNRDFFSRSGSVCSSVFIISAALILVTTAAAKLYSAGGAMRILGVADPILEISFRHVLVLAAVLELGTALVCLVWRTRFWPVCMVAWLGTIFLVYRAGVWLTGASKPCQCLGALTDALHLSPQAADRVALLLLGYLVIGSYALLLKEFQMSPGARRSCALAPSGSHQNA
jgi:hypothetical protein